VGEKRFTDIERKGRSGRRVLNRIKDEMDFNSNSRANCKRISDIKQRQTGIRLVRELVNEFSITTSSELGLPVEFHTTCQDEFEVLHKKPKDAIRPYN
jgi:hypothetical protein